MSRKPGAIVFVGAHVPGIVVEVERIPAEGETVLGSSYSERIDGGKATNQAVAAARLGAPVSIITVIGNDDRSHWWRSYFAGVGIDGTWIVEADGPLDVGVILLPPSRIPAIVSVVQLSLRLDAAAVLRAADAIRAASVLVCQLEAPQAAVLEALRIARAAGVLTILNPAPAALLDPGILEHTDLLVPNEHEAAALAGASAEPASLASELITRLPVGALVVTAGAAGAYIATNGRPVAHVPAPPVSVADTTGAGDAFVGALAVRLREGAGLDEAVRFGVQVASVSVTRAGTMTSYPTLAEVAQASAAWSRLGTPSDSSAGIER